MGKRGIRDPELVRAAASGDRAKVEQLLDAGADPNERDSVSGLAAIHSAAARGDVHLVRLLVERGAEVDLLTDPEGPAPQEDFTALMVACQNGHSHVVDALLALGADVNARFGADHGSTALEQAASAGHESLVEQLLALGAKPDRAILFGPVWRSHTRIARLLLDAGANPHDLSGMGKPILVRACDRPFKDVDEPAQREIVTMLMEAGIDLEARDDLGATALIAAVRRKNTPLALLLLAKGADATARDDGNLTALHAAVRDRNMDLAEALLRSGADPSVQDTFKESPISIAKENRDKPMLALLERYAAADRAL